MLNCNLNQQYRTLEGIKEKNEKGPDTIQAFRIWWLHLDSN